MESNEIVLHLASVLGDNFKLSLEDVAKEKTEEDQEILYGLICLHDDLKFYKKKSDNVLDNLKNTLFNSAAITVTGRNGIIKDVNDYFLNLAGYHKKELLGKKLTMVDHPTIQSAEYASLIPDVLQGKTWRGEICNQRSDGEIFWLNTHVFPIRNTEGDIYEFWSVSTDVTQRKGMEQQLIDKNEELKQFTYMLSHDLKAPGRQINQLAEFIEEDFGDQFSPDCQEMFGVLRTSAKKLNSLIDGILEYSRADYTDESNASIDTNEIVKDFLASNVIPKNISIQLMNELPTIFGNEVKVYQIFDNLINNAIKYAKKEGGTIEISSSITSNKEYKFEIKDQGIGIEEKYLSSIFDMFVTAHPYSDADSTGIGLPLVKKIIESFGGQIGCSSQIGVGSTFWFTWPNNQI